MDEQIKRLSPAERSIAVAAGLFRQPAAAPVYPVIPEPPAPDATDSRESYGLQLLGYLIRERTACRFSDEQISLALHVSPIAAAVYVHVGPDRSRSVDYRTAAADAVADAKRELIGEQRRRLQLQPTAEQPAGAGGQDEQLPGGALVDRRPIVGPLSPAGAGAKLSQPAAAPALVDWDHTF